MESLYIVGIEPGFPYSPMTYPFSCGSSATLNQYRRRVNGTKRSREPILAAGKGVDLPELFSSTDGQGRILGVWFGPGLHLEKITPKAIVHESRTEEFDAYVTSFAGWLHFLFIATVSRRSGACS